MTKRLTHKQVSAVLRYERGTGKLFWIVDQPYGAKRIKAGQEAGCYCGDGYVRVRIKGVLYLGHRVAWLLAKKKWPKLELDHVRGKEHGNKWRNLRNASHQQNRRNNKKRNNCSGYPSVTRHHRDARWKAQIHLNGKNKYLGLYQTPVEAFAAYDAAAKKAWGQFYRWKEGLSDGTH